MKLTSHCRQNLPFCAFEAYDDCVALPCNYCVMALYQGKITSTLPSASNRKLTFKYFFVVIRAHWESQMFGYYLVFPCTLAVAMNFFAL